MDPFIESEDWQDFHVSLTVEIKRQLVPQLPEHYQLTAELTVMDTEDAEERTSRRSYRPDVGISLTDGDENILYDSGGGAISLTPPTKRFAAPVRKQRHLLLRDRRDRRLVTAIEVLSPSNKGSGLFQHIRKLESFWRRQVTTIDIDLFRGGTSPYASEENEWDAWPEGAYHVVTTEPDRQTAVWAIGLTDPLPTIPVPLSYPDPPAVLDLQRAFGEFYAYSTYRRRRVKDLAQLRPPLEKNEVALLAECLR